jgi:DNA-binding MltR family transcriptional regulator
MTWTMLSPKELKVISEIEKQTDRAAAVIAGAFVERRLTNLIKSALRQQTESEQEAMESLFRESGPLGSFHARIDMGLTLALYPEEVWKDLHTIKLIRNEFAHRTSPIHFNSGDIQRLCRKLQLPKLRKPLVVPLDPKTLKPEIEYDTAKPRERYMLAIQLALAEIIRTPVTPHASKWARTAPFDAPPT